MAAKLEISTQHTALTDDLQKYIAKKIGRLDRFAPRVARESMHIQVKLKESRAKDKKQFTCAVIVHLPQQVLEAEESTINMFAAVDIAETKLRHQLKKYKETHTKRRVHQRLLRRLRNSS